MVVRLITCQLWLPEEGGDGSSADRTGSRLVEVEDLGARGMAETLTVAVRRDPGMASLGQTPQLRLGHPAAEEDMLEPRV